MAEKLETLSFATPRAWSTWLAKHHAKAPGVWLQLARKDAGVASVSREEALEAALCFGWIDGQAQAVDGLHWRQKFTPRRKRSLWSKRNREKAEALIAAGRMKPAGLAEIERAKADGRWEAAYEAQSRIEVPKDLQGALDANSQAQEFFLSLDSRNRYAVLFRLQTAKKEETRKARLAKFIAMLARGERIYP